MSTSYGVTKEGFNLKRMDTICSGLHAKLTAGWGFDTTINEQSAINVLVRDFAAECAEIWEAGQDVYSSQYPTDAEGISLDNAMAFGGVTRLSDQRTVYSLSCTGDDGTDILYGTLVRSNTQPAKDFQCLSLQTISRSNFRKINITATESSASTLYSIEINGTSYSYSSTAGDSATVVLTWLKDAITDESLNISLDTSGEETVLVIEDSVKSASNTAVLSNNLKVSKVVSNLLFESVEYGDIIMPNGTITQIVTAVSGLDSVTNDISRVAGRIEETDVAARQSYQKRASVRATNIIDGITASLYELDGVLSAVGRENVETTEDSEGRPPHSIEIICDGGDDTEVANTIYKKRTPGIKAYGSTHVEIADASGNIMTIGFSRPTYKYVWLKVSLTKSSSVTVGSNYKSLVKDAIVSNSNQFGLGQKVVLRQLEPFIDETLPGMDDVDILAAVTESESETPDDSDYTLRIIPIGSREKAQFASERIEVTMENE